MSVKGYTVAYRSKRAKEEFIELASLDDRIRRGWDPAKKFVDGRKVRRFLPSGESVKDAARRTKIGRNTIIARLEAGCTGESILRPVRQGLKLPSGETVAEAAIRTGLTKAIIYKRLKYGAPGKDVLRPASPRKPRRKPSAIESLNRGSNS